MTPSKACEAFVQGFEKCRLSSYMPTPRDRPTIGFGTTGPDIHMGMTWTLAQCDARFSADLAKFAKGVSDALTVPTQQREFDAFVSLAYNIGLDAFRKSTALKRHNAGEKQQAADAILFWNRQAGDVLAGLDRRRKGERAMYLGVKP